MGWTHYWEREIELPKGVFSKVVDDCKALLDKIELGISGSGGYGDAEFDSNGIVFNGADGMVCEDFTFVRIQVPRRNRERALGYCKTEHLPYDLYVQMVLIILKHHLGDMMKVASDGSEKDWQKAKDVCQEHLGYGSDFELETIS